MTFSPSQRRRGLIAVLAAASLMLVACGDDNGDDETASTDTTEAEETTTTEMDMAGEMVEVTAVDYAFEGLPDEIAAGTMLSFTNSSTAEIHELVVLKFAEGEQRSLEELSALSEEESASAFVPGPPATVLIAPPGGAAQIAALGDGTISEPGRYAVICAIPTGADPAEYLAAAQSETDGPPPSVAGGPPHFTQGMFAELTVE
ncbi:hypothetical protein BH18ACT4_BH18ACT4_11330 [soil metagenome]